jgi:hypothetical protein
MLHAEDQRDSMETTCEDLNDRYNGPVRAERNGFNTLEIERKWVFVNGCRNAQCRKSLI